MTFSKQFSFSIIFSMVVTMANSSGLTTTYYNYSCPNLLTISKQITESYVKNVSSTYAPGLLRMVFHDCAVQGCDASLLLDPTPENNQTEKDAIPNSTLKGFEVINAIKAKLEEECPDVVSCADVLSLAARDAIVAINGPYWDVPLGRKDGITSLASKALASLPSPFADIATLKRNFADLGLTPKELAILSGAHTIGKGHCFIIQSRLYNYTGKGDTDPTLDSSYAAWLKTQCPPVNGDLQSFVYMDPSPFVFDVKYYNTVKQHKGLFHSDAALLDDPETSVYLLTQDLTNGLTFAKDFGDAMTKLIQIGVLYEGQVRKTCGAVRYY